MSGLNITSNYVGDLIENIYLKLGVGWKLADYVTVKTDIAKSGFLPAMTYSTGLQDYTDGVPSTEGTLTYTERELVMKAFTEYLPGIKPTDFIGGATNKGIWKEMQATGDYTNAELNTIVVDAIVNLIEDSIAEDVQAGFWAGTNGPGSFEGIITKATGVAPTITAQGAISGSNFYDILADFYDNINDAQMEASDYVIGCSYATYKLIKSQNTLLKKSYAGVLDVDGEVSFQGIKLVPFVGFPENTLLGFQPKNLVYGVWVDPSDEVMIIDKVNNAGKEHFARIDYSVGAQFRNADDLLLYLPA